MKKKEFKEISSTSDPHIKLKKIHFYISLIIASLVFLVFFFFEKLGAYSFIKGITFGICALIGSYILLIVPFYIIDLFVFFIILAKDTSNINFVNEMKNKLARTGKGVYELQKLYSFKAFLNDFGHFVDKNPEEVILWDRYLSYAQVFGLTEKIIDSDIRK